MRRPDRHYNEDNYTDDDRYIDDNRHLTENERRHDRKRKDGSFISRHPIIANLAIILAVAAIGLLIAYMSLAIFTKHGQTDKVPRVVNMSYSSAVEKLHEQGFKVEIRDSVYMSDVKPGLVVDQFPAAGAIVKPERKIYLYINAVHPKEVIIDGSGDSRQPALRGLSMRQAQAQLQELGFKRVQLQYVLGDTDRVIKVLANGNMVHKMQKVPVNAKITLVVYDNRKTALADSLLNMDNQPVSSGYYEDWDTPTYSEEYEWEEPISEEENTIGNENPGEMHVGDE